MNQEKPRFDIVRFLARPEVAAALLLPLLTLALWTFPATPRTFPDDYLRWAQQPFFSKAFWLGSRPPAATFFYKLCGYDLQVAVHAQQAFSVFCWLALGLVTARSFKGRFSPFIVLLFGLAATCWNIGAWSFAILTESLSFSLFALFLAVLMPARRKGAVWPLVAMVPVVLLFSFTRDQVAYFLLSFLWLCVPVCLVFRREDERKWLMPVLAVSYSLVFLVQGYLGQLARRHEFPLINVFFQRVLPDEVLSQWFSKAGAPLEIVADDTLEWSGQWTSSHGFVLYREEKYKPWRAWIMEEGKGTYARFLATHPAYSFSRAWSSRKEILSYNLGYIKKKGKTAIMQFSDNLWRPGRAWMWAVVVLYLVLLWPARLDPLPLVIGVCSVVNGVFAYHADAMEVPRHCVFTGVGLQVALWYALIAVLGAPAVQSRLGRLIRRGKPTEAPV